MALCALCETEGNYLPLQGSSANPSGTGNRYRIEDIPEEITSLADIVIDYGVSKYAALAEGRGATILDFSSREEGAVGVFRVGVLYDVIRDRLQRFWGIEIPPDPGMGEAKFGHLKILPEVESLRRLKEEMELKGKENGGS